MSYIWLARVMILITAAFLMWGVGMPGKHIKFFEDDNNVEKSKQNQILKPLLRKRLHDDWYSY
jgi:hypothetical protein